jgi:hypothetical protein
MPRFEALAAHRTQIEVGFAEATDSGESKGSAHLSIWVVIRPTFGLRPLRKMSSIVAMKVREDHHSETSSSLF